VNHIAPPDCVCHPQCRKELRSDPRRRNAVSDVKGDWERIHRRIADRQLLAAPPSCSRVADCNPNLGLLCGLPPPRGFADCTGHCNMCAAQGMWAVRTRRSSPPSSNPSTWRAAVSLECRASKWPLAYRLAPGNKGYGVSSAPGVNRTSHDAD